MGPPLCIFAGISPPHIQKPSPNVVILSERSESKDPYPYSVENGFFDSAANRGSAQNDITVVLSSLKNPG